MLARLSSQQLWTVRQQQAMGVLHCEPVDHAGRHLHTLLPLSTQHAQACTQALSLQDLAPLAKRNSWPRSVNLVDTLLNRYMPGGEQLRSCVQSIRQAINGASRWFSTFMSGMYMAKPLGSLLPMSTPLRGSKLSRTARRSTWWPHPSTSQQPSPAQAKQQEREAPPQLQGSGKGAMC